MSQTGRRGALRHVRANAVAYLALFVALGGTSAYAAGALPKASVGAKQLKRNAVASPKVKDGSLRAVDFAAGQLPSASRGAAGAPGATGPQGERGPAGPQGDQGPSGFSVFDGSLPSGKTMSGYFSLQMPMANGERVMFGISFPVSAPSQPLGVRFAPGAGGEPGDTDPACDGSSEEPTAPPGLVCIYSKGNGGSNGYYAANLGRRGFSFSFASTGGAFSSYHGVWAYTAP